MSDFDDLDRLKAALKAPQPRMDAKEAAFRLAEENFARMQESLQETGGFERPTKTAPTRRGVLNGVRTMFANAPLKPLYWATSSLVVIGLGFVVLQQVDTNTAFRESDDLIIAEPVLEGPIIEEPIIVEPLIVEPVIVEEDFEEAAPAPERLADALSTAAPKVSSRMAAAPQAGAARSQLVAPRDVTRPGPINRDRFASEVPNSLKITAEEPVSTFSIDVDTASYAWIRRSLQNGALPDAQAVRVEEMINYFTYDYPAPTGDSPFATQVTVSETPWNAGTQLVQIGLQGALPEVEDRPPLNLVFLIDTSGSMNSPDKLPLLIQSFRLMLSELRPEDEVAIVTYAGSAGLVLEPTPASEAAKINAALTRLSAGGSTAGGAGLQQAYDVAAQMAEEGDISRVLLATDGDFNVGLSSDEEMKTLIEARRDSGTFLSVLGFGRGNLNDALMQTLAQNGNGQAAYIDTLAEARKVLVDQLTGALFPIASDVKVQVEWNPAEVAEYRLIGYETRALNREDFNNDRVDAGEIGAGLQVTALYEVTPVGSEAVLNDPLRYGTSAAQGTEGELGFLRLRYKSPGETQSQLIVQPIAAGTTSQPGFAAAIAGFGQLLRNSTYLGDWGYADAVALANQTKGADPFGYRSEALTLMRLADSLSKAP